MNLYFYYIILLELNLKNYIYNIYFIKKAIKEASKMYGLLLLNMSEFIINKVSQQRSIES